MGDTAAHCVGCVGYVCEGMSVCGVNVYVYGVCKSVNVVCANVVYVWECVWCEYGMCVRECVVCGVCGMCVNVYGVCVVCEESMSVSV